jgi:hypothetical protein
MENSLAELPHGYAGFSGSENTEQCSNANVAKGSDTNPINVETNCYQKHHKIIKDILFIPVSIIGFCIVIVSVGIMAILGGFVVVFYIVKGCCEGVVNDCSIVYKYMFETETETVANIAAVVADVHIIDVRICDGATATQSVVTDPEYVTLVKYSKIIDIISENNVNHSDILPIAIALNKRQIIPL